MSETPEPIEPSSRETSSPETSSPETSSPETSSPETSSPETSSPETSRSEPTAPAAAPTQGRGRATLIVATLVYFAWSLVIGVLATWNDGAPLPRVIRFVLGALLWIAIWKGHRWARVTMGVLAIVGLVGGSILAYFSGLLVLAKASPLVLVAWALLFDGATKDYVASRKKAAPRT